MPSVTSSQRHRRIHSSEMHLAQPTRLNGLELPAPVLQTARGEPSCSDCAAATGSTASAGSIKAIDSDGGFSTSASSKSIVEVEYSSSGGSQSGESCDGSSDRHPARPLHGRLPFRRLFKWAGRAIRMIARRISPQGKGVAMWHCVLSQCTCVTHALPGAYRMGFG